MAEPVKIGEFKELIMYRVPVRTKSDKGQVKEVFSDYSKAFVKIIESGNEEQKQGDRINLPGLLTITGHYYSAVDTSYRVLWNSVEYAITSITAVQNRRYMIVTAEKVFE